jgi:hypothetical protein
VGGPNGGDAFTNYLVSGAGTYSVGIDNSDSDKFKITSGTSPSAGTNLLTSTSVGAFNIPLTLAVGVAALSGNVQLQNARTAVGTGVQIESINQDDTNTASHAAIGVRVGGNSGGDPIFYWSIGAGVSYVFHLDNSDSDILKLRSGSDVAASPVILQSTAACEVTMPLQPAFCAYLNPTVSNVTGDGTIYTIVFGNERFDQNADYATATGVFTAPVTGKYILSASITASEFTTNNTTGYMFINTSNVNYLGNSANPNACKRADGYYAFFTECLADMDAADVAYVTLTVSATDKGVDIPGDVSPHTRFCGSLQC